MAKKTKQPPGSIKMCLCGTCATSFYYAGDSIIKRVNRKQVRRDTCDFCNYRSGYDYFLINRINYAAASADKNRTIGKSNKKHYDKKGKAFPVTPKR